MRRQGCVNLCVWVCVSHSPVSQNEQSRLESANAELQDAENDLDLLFKEKEKISNLLCERGKLQERCELIRRNINDNLKTIEKTLEDLPQCVLHTPTVTSVMKKLKKQTDVDTKLAVLDQLKTLLVAASADEKAKMDTAIREKDEQVQSLRKQRQNLETSRQSLMRKRDQLSSAVSQAKTQMDEREELESELRKAESLMRELCDQRVCGPTLESVQAELTQLESSRDSLRDEEFELAAVIEATEQCREYLVEINAQRKKLCEYETRIHTLKEIDKTHTYKRLESMCGPLDTSVWESEVESQLTKSTRELERHKEVLHNKARDHGMAEKEASMVQRRIRNLEAEKDALKSELYTSLSVDDEGAYTKLKTQTAQQLEEAMKDLMVVENAQQLHTNYYEYSIKRKTCAFCVRKFGNDKEVEAFKKNLKTRMDQMPERRGIALKHLEENRDLVTKIEQASDKVARLTQLQTVELPHLHTEKIKTTKALEEAQKQLEAAQETAIKLNQSVNELGQLSKVLKELDDLETESTMVAE
eukprot:Blabericola_migrator_1__10328@NODE_580_length_7497_cov_126_900135_g430_i0_p2_GENE_NODE_580_length_7497_cov_126_900135_g430_i0NODE_580_length_7497_cov_126_900135_g430_i0_p2_ORF_typecomplete_len530_score192_00DUF3584/PF12128_8/0_019DUF3584/PF12128_8/3_3TMF_TATA_bd/PF12325_8/22TMF_TATA_bd/PF12325_8/0_42TMF_TATA_bd/PF12325_8/0_07TMF_TATA_bd/PF12325_8/36TMF_TATA_bd/PF12325_8/1_7e02HOOK/PF05622_12/2_3e02HOOK/PF05622_12/0_0065AAA_13/PF13166_6/0_88AAA_13/PF13166_6/61AAA_13/PF13166_6/28PAP_RNAbind/PF0492